jgi:hypothetical protein
MKRYKQNKLITKPEYGDDAFGIEDCTYHIHEKDLIEGNCSIEMELFENILQQINIDVDSLSVTQVFKCYEIIHEGVMAGYNAKLEEECH